MSKREAEIDKHREQHVPEVPRVTKTAATSEHENVKVTKQVKYEDQVVTVKKEVQKPDAKKKSAAKSDIRESLKR